MFLLAALLGVAGMAEGASSVTLRGEVEVTKGEVTLGDVARLRGAYAAELSELVVAELGEGQESLELTMQDVRRRLDEQEVHWGRLVCRGSQRVMVRRVAAAEEEDRAPRVLSNPPSPVSAEDGDLPASQTLKGRMRAWLEQQAPVGERGEVDIAFEESDEPVLDSPLGPGRLEFEPLTSQALGRVLVTVRRYVGGEVAETQRVRATVEIRQPAVVARRSLGRGQVITEGDLEVRTITVTSMRKKPLTEAASAVGQESVGLLRAGAVVHVDDVRAPVLVRRGQAVTVRAISGGVVLRTVGRAMADGERGELIALRNERTREQFYARVTGPQEAAVNLDEDASVAAKEEGR